jgi:hypothetical protein
MQQNDLVAIYTPDDYKNELQFIVSKELHKIQHKCSVILQQVDKSINNPCDEIHEDLIREYSELKKVQSILDSVITSMRWHNGDHSMYDGVDG